MEPATIISVATPSYYQGVFLAETIKSVIDQEGDFSIGYIIIDGSSTDRSVDIIKKYDELLQKGKLSAKSRGICYRWVSEKDKGQADALLKGYLMATGQILAWLNSDDTYLPEALRSAADFFRDHPETAPLYGKSHYCDLTGAVIGSYWTEDFTFDKLAWFNFI
jgi:glycosyltransferase involved in cell wall biosynthesis